MLVLPRSVLSAETAANETPSTFRQLEAVEDGTCVGSEVPVGHADPLRPSSRARGVHDIDEVVGLVHGVGPRVRLLRERRSVDLQHDAVERR